jgi:predicted secreted protein
MRLLPLALLALAGCATGNLDPHRPRTIEAQAEGGSVSVKHGQRVHVPISAAESGYLWRMREPMVMAIVVEGPLAPEGLYFTAVRSGDEKLRLEYAKAGDDTPAERTVTYDVSVR